MTIKKYQVLIHGRNFILEMDGDGPRKYGFYVTCYVEAPSPDDAETKAFEVLSNDRELRVWVRNLPEDRPDMFVEKLAEISEFPAEVVNRNGLALYTDEEDELN